MEENSCNVSIIVPVYNVERYLPKCVDSLLNQTLKSIEIILVDDGSTDGSGLICDQLTDQYNHVKVIHQENTGLGLARNSGLVMARGEYVAFVDSDDFVNSRMFSHLYDLAKQYDADAVYGKHKRFWKEEICESEILKESLQIWHDDQIRQYILDRIGLPPTDLDDCYYGAPVCGGIFRRSIITDNNLKFVSERQFIAEDIVFDIDFLPHCSTIVHCNDLLYYYRYNPVSLTTTYKFDRFERNVELYHEMNRRLRQRYSKEECFDSMARYFLTFTRVAMIQEVVHLKHNGCVHAYRKIADITNSYDLQMILKRYQYFKLPLKLRIYCWAQKHKKYVMLLFLTILSKL